MVNLQADVRLTIHLIDLPGSPGNIDMDSDTLTEILENALKQPFSDGIVNLCLPVPATAKVTVDYILYNEPAPRLEDPNIVPYMREIGTTDGHKWISYTARYMGKDLPFSSYLKMSTWAMQRKLVLKYVENF